MKRFILLCAVAAICIQQSAAQTDSSKYPFLNINGIPTLATKSSIVKTLGKPQKIYRPHYDCGFFSEDQGHPYYSIKYNYLNWIGNEKEGYQAEDIILTKNSPYHLTFKGHPISANTSIGDFMNYSGIKKFNAAKAGDFPEDLLRYAHASAKSNFKFIDLLPAKGDDKYIFYFINDKLVKIELWTPC